MATKFLDRDEQDAVGIINRQLTLTEATPISGEGAAAATTPSAIMPSGAAPAPATSSQATDTSESTQPTVEDAATSGSAASGASGEAAEEGVGAAEDEPAANGLMDGLKIVAQNGHAKADASREERLNVGQAPVIFDTADSPACTECGSIMVRNGSCYKCINCGATSGCS
jgi:ribonucleoside-diphosphate reductase alpha chain